MKKKILSIIMALVLLFSGASVFAENNSSTSVERKIKKEFVYAQKDGMDFEEGVLLFDNAGNEITSDEIKKGDFLTIFKNSEGKIW